MLGKIVFFNNFALEVTLTRNRFMRALQPTVYIRVLGFVGDIFLPRTTGYDGCWLAGKTRGRNESCYGDLRPLDDALARAAGTPPRTKCISFRCFIRFLCISSHWDNEAILYHSLGISHHLTASSLLKAVFSLLFYNTVVLK